jgi:hypothetical protein
VISTSTVLGVCGVASAIAPFLPGSRRVWGVLRLWASVGSMALFRLAVPLWLASASLAPGVPLTLRIALGIAAAALALSAPVLILDGYLRREVLGRDRGPDPMVPGPAGRVNVKVSVHVPCYAEPPEVVNATLDALARQDHGDFEVIVVDNNTKDESLWLPVQRHCRALGGRFRFHHVDPLSGAKAGALNFALARAHPVTEYVAVVDADYQAEPGFLRTLAGFAARHGLAFVQTRHDYRDWEHNKYLEGCYWEYRESYAGYLFSRSRWGSALTTGTMCLVRRDALAAVGGWAEWCCTEDSELAIRLLAAGYRGLYVPQTFGRGLMPERFAGYQRQRFRWIFGPAREFRRHWRLFLPRRWARPSRLRPSQKVLMANHGLRELVLSAQSILVSACALLAAAAVVRPGAAGPAVPGIALLAVAAGNLSELATNWRLLRREPGCSRAAALRAVLSHLALSGVTRAAGGAG